MGDPVAYRIVPQDNAVPYLHPLSPVMQRVRDLFACAPLRSFSAPLSRSLSLGLSVSLFFPFALLSLRLSLSLFPSSFLFSVNFVCFVLTPPCSQAGFIARHLWVTPYHPSEMYPADSYPNKPSFAVDNGLPTWTKQNRELVNKPLVAWYTLGVLHIPRLEVRVVAHLLSI